MNLSGADMQMQEMQDRLAAVTARAEAAEQALRLATSSEPGKPTAVLMTLDKWIEWYMQLAAATERAEKAEAALAAVPVDALRRTLFTGYRTDAQITTDADAINAWLNSGQ